MLQNTSHRQIWLKECVSISSAARNQVIKNFVEVESSDYQVTGCCHIPPCLSLRIIPFLTHVSWPLLPAADFYISSGMQQFLYELDVQRGSKDDVPADSVVRLLYMCCQSLITHHPCCPS